MTDARDPLITGRCYCGATRLTAASLPSAVAYCHCADCKRASGAPFAAHAAFVETDVSILGGPTGVASSQPGAERTFCSNCRSPIMSRCDYLPGQVYLPIGLLDQAEVLEPMLHAHTAEALPWLHMADGLPRHDASSRYALNKAADDHE